MPSTPLRSPGIGPGSEASGDTERPPADSPGSAEPASGVGGVGGIADATRIGPPPAPSAPRVPAAPATTQVEATRIGPPPPLPLPSASLKAAAPAGEPPRSSGKLAAAPPASVPRVPAAAAPAAAPAPASVPGSAPRVPAAPAAPVPGSAPRVPAATIVHAGAPPSAGTMPVQPVAATPQRKVLAMPRTPAFAFTPQGAVAAPIANTVPAPALAHALETPAMPAEPAVPGEAPLTRRCTACNERYPADFLVCPRDATPLVDESGEAVDPLVGKLLGETYQIIRVVGEGGMGRIYEARHLRLKERRFAVKTLHGELARNSEMAARFLREAETASSINHPNVVDVFDVHHLADGTPYFVGEFLEGEELAQFVETRRALKPKVAIGVARQICAALVAAHARGIIHRDMKPENVFVLGSSIDAFDRGESSSLQVKILDFGISKAGGTEQTHLTRTGVIMGTPSYMAPEQARGKQVDHRADVYSVGAVLYYAITGKRPFDSDDPTATISMVLTQDPVRPRQVDPKIPEALELVVQRAMAKDARERYQTMAELEKALAQLADAARSSASIALPSGRTTASEAKEDTAFGMAKAMLAGSSIAPPAATSGNQARLARPTIIATSGVLGLWLVGGTTGALAGLVRVLHEGEITGTECVLLVVGCLFAAATPLALYVAHVKKVIWPNSVRAVQLAADLKRTSAAAIATYGGLALTSRIVYTVFARSSKGLSSGVWDIVLFLVSLLAALTVGGAGPLVRNMRRRRNG